MRPDLLWPLGFLLVLAITAHVLLSPLGFNLTDDGFVLAQSRRLLAGEIPHRDFISIRPVGSALFHTLDLIVGGEHTFLVSRLFFWLEVAIGCWAWLAVLLVGRPARPGLMFTLPLSALAFLFSTHAFPPMAWYTVDAILLASLGFLASGTRDHRLGLLGHGLIGAAAICKQNFLPLTFAAVILRGRTRQPAAWLAALAAPVLYVLVLAALGAAPAMRLQLTAVTGLFASGVRPYVREGWFVSGAALGALLAWLATRPAPAALRLVALAAGAAAVVFAGRAFDAEGFHFILSEAFFVFGLAAGALVVPLVRREWSPTLTAGGFAVALAWCTAVSLGYLSPALAGGPLVLVFGFVLLGAPGADGRSPARLAPAVCAALALLLLAPHWWSARRDHIYHEATAPLLTHDLGGVLPGGRGIRTNSNTYAMLQELHDTATGLQGRRYALLVDGPGWWVCASQRNPLPVDWANGMELPTDSLRQRVADSVLRQRGALAVIVQRATGLRSSAGFRPVPLDDPFYGAAAWAVRTLEPESGSMYWTVYR